MKKQTIAFHYVAIGQPHNGTPEAINSFADIKDASMCASEFVANNAKSTGWVELISERKDAIS